VENNDNIIDGGGPVKSKTKHELESSEPVANSG
jgi:hypothetical protein